jgi:uncharacterized protein (DUF2235 family)
MQIRISSPKATLMVLAPMPKNIVVFIDGTWLNATSAVTPSTNAYFLSQALSAKNQLNLYFPGVGSGLGKLGKYFHGATGKGVFYTARLAWQQIVANYEDGDRIFIFGFSRGAFAARHLAGMIVRYGLRGWQGSLEETFRDWLAHVCEPCTKVQKEVHLLGLFDCVPGNQLYVWRDRLRCLNTTRLESGILHVRHAVSKHERRWSFRPLIFDPSKDHDSFAQHWFPGFHSDVGGGVGVADGLAGLSLWWMIREAYGLGLDIKNIDCAFHRSRRALKHGHALGVLRAADPDAAPVCSDNWFTRRGLRWNRMERETKVIPDPTPDFALLDECPRCGEEMFDYFLTEPGQRWMQPKKQSPSVIESNES